MNIYDKLTKDIDIPQAHKCFNECADFHYIDYDLVYCGHCNAPIIAKTVSQSKPPPAWYER